MQSSKKRAVITIQGTTAQLEITPLTDAIQDALVDVSSWTDPQDLTRTVCFYNQEESCVAHGLAHKFQSVLQENGYRVDLTYPEITRLKTAAHWEVTKPPKSVRQRKLVDDFAKGIWGTWVAPAGLGKTYVIAAATVEAKARTLIVSYNSAATFQIAKTFQTFTNISPGVLAGKHKKESGRPVYIANMQMLMAMRKARNPLYSWICEKVRLVIFDEGHHAKAHGALTLLDDLRNVQSVAAVTATWGTADGKDLILEAVIGPVRSVITRAEATEGGDICPTTFIVARVPKKWYFRSEESVTENTAMTLRGAEQEPEIVDRAAQYREVEKRYIIEGETGRNKIIRDWVSAQRRKGRTGVIIVNRIPHADILCKMIPNLTPIVASNGKVVRSLNERDREAVLERFRKRDPSVDWVVATTFDEAVDIPTLDCVVLAAGGKSWIKFDQRQRNARTFKGMTMQGYYHKKRCYTLILKDDTDFFGNHAAQNIRRARSYVKAHEGNKLVVLEEA